MKTSLTSDATEALLARLRSANESHAANYPGDSGERQAVHTVYGGAHLFKAGTGAKMGQIALRNLREYFPTYISFAKALGLHWEDKIPADAEADDASLLTENEGARFANTIYQRVIAKLEREAVEDFRIDFEDGYGNRTDEEEDAHAVQAAEQTAEGMKAASLPPFIGIRIKPFTEELRARSVRTLDHFVTTLANRADKKLPDNFVVTLPKVTIPEQVEALATLLSMLEERTGLAPGSIKVEIMIETTQSVFATDGRVALLALVRAGAGRVVGAHFGTYDYTAGYEITAAYQSMTHPACDFAKHVMKVALAGTGVALSDGATTVMPVPRHRASKDGPPLTGKQIGENHAAVHSASRLHYDQARNSLANGYYQGWDLHPAQLITRYAAVYSFFLEGLEAASHRLTNFVDKAAQATLVGDVFDDAATGQGLLNYFLRGLNCGALTLEEAKVTGLSLEEFKTRSFVRILDGRRASA